MDRNYWAGDEHLEMTDEEMDVIDDLYSATLQIEIVRLTDTAKIPTRGSKYAAGYDLYVDCKDEVLIRPHTTQYFKTGIAMAIPKGFYGAIYARSGLATRQGLRPPNCVGVIDADYRGEIGLPLHNDTDITQTVAPYQRVAQMVVQHCVGVIDADYRGEIGLPLHNDTDITQTVAPYQRVAQMVVQTCWKLDFREVDALNDTKRGNNGFGSTGI